MRSRTFSTEAVVLKRKNLGEADRLVTLFTKRFGKLTALAKGVRRITSRRAGSLEPATQGIFFFARGKNFDLITQVQPINSFLNARQNLARLTQINQILEIIDLLTVDNQEHPDIYQILLDTLMLLNTDGKKRSRIVANIRHIVHLLGFGLPSDQSESSLKTHIESIAEKELRSKKCLIYNWSYG